MFTDKTGTLTENEMQFRECSINGIKYREVNGKLVPEGMTDDSPDGSATHLVMYTLVWMQTHSPHCHQIHIMVMCLYCICLNQALLLLEVYYSCLLGTAVCHCMEILYHFILASFICFLPLSRLMRNYCSSRLCRCATQFRSAMTSLTAWLEGEIRSPMQMASPLTTWNIMPLHRMRKL